MLPVSPRLAWCSPERGTLTGGFVALCLVADRVVKQWIIFNGVLGLSRVVSIVVFMHTK